MDETQLQIVSDLHLEAPAAYDVFNITPKAPYLALLGDIGYAKDDGLFDFLRRQLANFRAVFFVFGNHEPYYSNWTTTKSKVKHFEEEMNVSFQKGEVSGKFVLLDQRRYDLSPTTTILGCSLFSYVASDQMDQVSFGLNDFYHIGDWSVEQHRDVHLADLAWLNREVESISESEPQRKIIVLTHYCPSTDKKVIDPRHANSKISSGFMTNLRSEKCWQNRVVKLWAFGHTHFNCDFQDEETEKRVFSNQRGYYFAQSAGFDIEKIVQV